MTEVFPADILKKYPKNSLKKCYHHLGIMMKFAKKNVLKTNHWVQTSLFYVSFFCADHLPTKKTSKQDVSGKIFSKEGKEKAQRENLFTGLFEYDREHYYKYQHMGPERFENLFDKFIPPATRQDTNKKKTYL